VPRYRVNARVGPWQVGDELESTDELHARLAEGGTFSVIEDEDTEPEEPVEEAPTLPFYQASNDPDNTPPEQPASND
jgi:hypothetical protein